MKFKIIDRFTTTIVREISLPDGITPDAIYDDGGNSGLDEDCICSYGDANGVGYQETAEVVEFEVTDATVRWEEIE